MCEVAQSCPTLCDPIDCSPPGSSIHGIFQARLPFPSPGALPNPGIEPGSLSLQADALSSEPPGKPSYCYAAAAAPAAAAAAAKSLQSCPTLCNHRDGSPPGTPVPGILQARTLEWVAISFSNA